MQETTGIYYRQRSEIDVDKWNRCVAGTTNGLIYGYSFYLDHVADHWDALILNDYEAVMPLPWRRKLGLYYLYQPYFAAQLGLFAQSVTVDLIESFLQAIPPKFKLWQFSLNHKNVFQLKNFHLYQRVNYVLSLCESYEQLYSNYRENTKRNIKKSVHYGFTIRTDVGVKDIISLAQQQSNSAEDSELKRFEQLYELLKERSMAKTYGVFSNKNELMASCVFTFSHNRAYYILVGNHPNGRTLGASHKLIDAFIKDHAGENLLLDFEGSDVRNLAFFYSSFGASIEVYSAINQNKLPWYVKWVKG